MIHNVFIIIIILAGISLILLTWVLRCAYLAPDNPPPQTRPGTRTIVCLGDSHTQGRCGFDFVAVLRALHPEILFLNQGRNSEMAVNIERRLDAALHARPTEVVILIGTNDVNAELSEANRKFYKFYNRLTREPSASVYTEEMQKILERLRKDSPQTRVALVSLPPIGEMLDSPANRRVREYNEILRRLATTYNAQYLPVGEALSQELKQSPSSHPHAYRDSMAFMMGSVARRYLLGQSWNEISQGRGFRLVTDYLHLNERAGAHIIREIDKFLKV